MTPNGSTETDMPLEAVRMAFTGQLAENYDVYYSVYQNGSWTTPVKNGETAGIEGQGLRVDGLWVTVTGKGAEVPEGPNGKSVDPTRPMVALTFDDGPSKYTPGSWIPWKRTAEEPHSSWWATELRPMRLP